MLRLKYGWSNNYILNPLSWILNLPLDARLNISGYDDSLNNNGYSKKNNNCISSVGLMVNKNEIRTFNGGTWSQYEHDNFQFSLFYLIDLFI